MTTIATPESASSEAVSAFAPVPAPVVPFASRQELNVWRRIECIMAECKRLPKTETNKEQDFDYTPYDDIAEMVRPLLARYGVAIMQEPVEFHRDGTLTRIKYEYEVINTDRPEDRFTKHNYGEGSDLSDKGINKASTVAEKFFLCRLFKISTGGDPDGAFVPVHRNGTPQARDSFRPAESGRQPDSRPRSQPPQPNGRETIECRCEQCGRLVTPAKKDGDTVSVKSILAASQREYRKNLCADCLLAERAKASAAATPVVYPSEGLS
jgi:hypothetical protein